MRVKYDQVVMLWPAKVVVAYQVPMSLMKGLATGEVVKVGGSAIK